VGEKTGIAWTDHTFNPWIGCQKVSEGCRHCYAERQNNDRFHWVSEWGKDYRRTSEQNWKKPIQWAKQAVKDDVIRRVFCASLADVFDANVPNQWRFDLWGLVLETQKIGGLEWLILTKRPENISTRIPCELSYPSSSVRMGVTAENQEMWDKRVHELLRSWAGKNFASYEPALGEIDFTSVDSIGDRQCLECWGNGETSGHYGSVDGMDTCASCGGKGEDFEAKIHWLICGAESGTNARPMDIEWARSVRDQCVAAGVPFYLKQMVVDGKLTVLPELDGRRWKEFPDF